MKKQRVDLLKNMRAENKKFQQFKNAKNKEIVQIKRLTSIGIDFRVSSIISPICATL